MMARVRSFFLFGVLVLASIVGCESIAGIEDHTYQASISMQCQTYCDTVMTNCTAAFAVYSNTATCLRVCANLPPGNPIETMDGNNVDCRLRKAKLAKGEPAFYCPRAGPGGAGPGDGEKCGSNCASYCSLLNSICPDEGKGLTNCEKQCSAVRDVVTFDVAANYGGDTLQCRLVHVSSAAAAESATHCGHAQLFPNAPCVDDPMTPPDCAYFCSLEMAACSGDVAAYESAAQCNAVCTSLPRGLNGQQAENTVGCRLYHSYNSLLVGPGHCPHTSPGGDGHCGMDQPDDTGNCHSYCLLLEKACSPLFLAQYAGDQATCRKECSTRPDATQNHGYQVAKAQTGNTLACRLLHVSRALSDATECPAAVGGAPCIDP
jgi:hypothetical protein